MILGIDPGITGGIALITRTGALRFAEAMPVLRNTVPTVDTYQVGRWVALAEGAEVFAYVERAQAMPRQGVSSAFTYGVIFGSILTALADLGIGYEFVSPAKWKRDLNLGPDKTAAIDRVRQMYPTLPLKRGDHGIAEAVLIARHGAGI